MKTFRLDLEGSEVLSQLVKQNKLTTMIAYIFRFALSIEFIKKIDENVIGKYFILEEFFRIFT